MSLLMGFKVSSVSFFPSTDRIRLISEGLFESSPALILAAFVYLEFVQ